MPLTAKGNEIKAALTKEYGAKRGTSILYAGKNKGTFTGIDSTKLDAALSKAERIRARVDAEFNESDHPRAPDGKFGSGGRPFDHGELNIPGRTKNINRDLDRYKVQQAKEEKATFKRHMSEHRAHKEALKEVLADRPHLEAKAKNLGVPVSKVIETIKSMPLRHQEMYVKKYQSETPEQRTAIKGAAA